ncbi:hypothetical protein [Streptomyces albus]|uniref:hypothetical protein n=1 Tax=Streptomyces albus TaxID=1888 RepID=UPI003F1ABB6F
MTWPSIQHMRSMVSSAALIRLITEIDDNGPIPPRGLARTFPDLTPHQLRHASEHARALGLVTPRPPLALTEAGKALAEIYEATARWARRNQHPAGNSDFVTRIRSTFDHMSRAASTGREHSQRPHDLEPDGQAAADLERVRELVDHWLYTYGQAAPEFAR